MTTKAQRARYLGIVCAMRYSVRVFLPTPGQQRRKIIIDQDCSGPGGSNMQTLLVMIQSPDVEVLGITVVSGNQWRDEEVARTLRLLEIIGRTDIPVMAGAAFPLVRTFEETRMWQERLRESGLGRGLGQPLVP